MREMKDSVVEWIGEIPANWKTERLKYLALLKKEKWASTYPNAIYIGLENIESFTGNLIDSESEYDREQALMFDKGDILFGKLRPYLAKVHLCKSIGCCSGEFCVFKASKRINTEFLWSVLISQGFIEQVNFSTYGTKMPRANADYIQNIYIPLPPINDQEMIAQMLDGKTLYIDHLISNVQAQIEKLKAYKQSLITEIVTKGLDPTVPMKDSGVEWIGEIPVHWPVTRIKNCFELRNERNYLPLEEVNLISLYTEQGVVQHSDIIETTGNRAVTADGYKKVYNRDIVVNIILCWMGAVGMSKYDGVTSPAYDIYKPLEGTFSEYYHYLFRTKRFNGECYRYGRGIMMMRWRTYSTEFRSIAIPEPPMDEQRRIVEYLDEKCAQIDRLISIKQQKIDKLNQYKKSLIYEYVTGKKEVD